MTKPEIIMEQGPDGWDGWIKYTCSYPGCPWARMVLGGGVSVERDAEKHMQAHVPGAQTSEFMTVRGGMGNDAFAATANLVNVARAMFANEGIDLKTVEEFRLSVKRNHDADKYGGDAVPMWDTFAEVTYPAPADETED